MAKDIIEALGPAPKRSSVRGRARP
jgi:hypothetical protein